jgi:hypothetical protein
MQRVLLDLRRARLSRRRLILDPPPPLTPSPVSKLHCKENLIYVFLFWELRGLSPNFHIHVSESDLYIPTIDLPILLQEICGPILGIYKSPTDTWMWKLGLRPRNSQKRNT